MYVIYVCYILEGVRLTFRRVCKSVVQYDVALSTSDRVLQIIYLLFRTSPRTHRPGFPAAYPRPSCPKDRPGAT